MVWVTGIEPATARSQSVGSARLSYTQMVGRERLELSANGLRVRCATIAPSTQIRPEGLEPPVCCLKGSGHTTWLRTHGGVNGS